MLGLLTAYQQPAGDITEIIFDHQIVSRPARSLLHDTASNLGQSFLYPGESEWLTGVEWFYETFGPKVRIREGADSRARS